MGRIGRAYPRHLELQPGMPGTGRRTFFLDRAVLRRRRLGRWLKAAAVFAAAALAYAAAG